MILVTGGAGYIGSHVNKLLHVKGYETIVLDNFVSGHKEAVQWGILSEGDIGDISHTSKLFEEHPIKAVMHFSSYINVGESVQHPKKYYINNVLNTMNLLNSYLEHSSEKTKIFIFSSTCAIYGQPKIVPITEDNPQKPINPYGESKLMIEKILQDYHKAYGLNYSILRYFNASGADPSGTIGEKHDPETHLIPLILDVALGKRNAIHIYGTDYETEDGTCIRDYIHVNDLAEAHILALKSLLGDAPMDKGKSSIYNLGTGRGYSVYEIIKASKKITGVDLEVREIERRLGDAPILVADPQKIMTELGWSSQSSDIETIIKTAWNWHQSL